MRDLTLQEVILITVYKRLKKFNWNRTYAADSLQCSIRALRNYIQVFVRLNIPIPPGERTENETSHFGNVSSELLKEVIREEAE
jgi:hypothetical protein